MTSGGAVFDGVAALYDETPNPMLALEGRCLRGLLPDVRGKDVVELGCGTGRWLREFQRLAPRSLTGIDPSSEMLRIARRHLGGQVILRRGTAERIPLAATSADLVLLSFALSYCGAIESVADEIARIARPGARLFLTDVHPITEKRLKWKRSFPSSTGTIHMHSAGFDLSAITATFEARGFRTRCVLELSFGEEEYPIFRDVGMTDAFHHTKGMPAIYIMQFEAQNQSEANSLALTGGRVALNATSSVATTIGVSAEYIRELSATAEAPNSLDLSGCLVLPGLVNAHDHLEFGLFPNLGRGPYNNCREWAEDIHVRHRDEVVLHSRVPKETRLLWGGLRNLLAGVTTVCHHNPGADIFRHPGFPVRVVDQIGWSHSLSFDPQTREKFHGSEPGRPFVIHAAEGVDLTTRGEVAELDSLGALDGRTVLVHGLNISQGDVALINSRGAALVVCPSSNQFLFSRCLEPALLRNLDRTALGTDSSLTAAGDMLDEIRVAKRQLHLSDLELFEMCTSRTASILQLSEGQGVVRPRSRADLLVVRDSGGTPASQLTHLDHSGLEMVLIGGEVKVVADGLVSRLSEEQRRGLYPLQVNDSRFWVRAPLPELFAKAEAVLGTSLQLGNKRVAYAG